MVGGDLVALSASALLVVLSALFAAIESATSRVTRVRALAWEEEGRPGADRLARVLEAVDGPLAAVVLLRMGLRLATATMVGIVGWRQGGAWGAAVAVAVLLATILVVGELLPRRLAIRKCDWVALRSAWLLSALARVTPLAALGSVVVGTSTSPLSRTRNGPNGGADERVNDSEGGDEELDVEEQQLIHSIFEFGDTVVREVMVPRTDMVTVPATATVDDAFDVAIPAGYSRLPVHRESQDDIVGLVFVKDLIRAARGSRGGTPVTEVLRKAVFVPEQKRAVELLREMQTRKFHMAVVVDEYGGTAGLVTLEDVLEEIVGEIVDEYDVEEPRVETLGDGMFRVAGRTPIDEVNELLDTDLPSVEWDTVGGLILDLVGHVPAEGESVTFQGIEFEAERVQGRRIVSVRIDAAPRPQAVDVPESS